MELLNYATLEQIGYDGFLKKEAPEKVLQFGEGNFLRAFADYFFDIANEKNDWNGKIVLVQPNSPDAEKAERINRQQGLYTLYLKGIENGRTVNKKRIISAVNRCLNARRDFAEVIEAGKGKDLESVSYTHLSNLALATISFLSLTLLTVSCTSRNSIRKEQIYQEQCGIIIGIFAAGDN